MSHFIIPYAGNKYKEFQFIEEYLNLDCVNKIIEPFCGTSAISFHIWLKYKDKYTYFLNDSSKEIFQYYNLIKSDNNPNQILENINDVKKSIKGKEDFIKIYKKKEKNVFENIIISKMSSFRIGLYNEKRININLLYKFTPLQLKFIEFIKCPYVHITNNDWFKSFDEYKNDEKVLFIFDPPYLLACNDFYNNKNINIYEYFFKNDIKNFKSKIFFILEDIWINNLLFQNVKKLCSYDKKYGISKKKTIHILFSN
jgi:hypothetical protein